MSAALALVDERIVPEEQAIVFWSDPGFRRGYGVFETIRVASGRPFLAGCHAQRLSEGAPKLGIDPWMHPRTLVRRLVRLIEASGARDAVLRVFLTPGPSPSGEAPAVPPGVSPFARAPAASSWGGSPFSGPVPAPVTVPIAAPIAGPVAAPIAGPIAASIAGPIAGSVTAPIPSGRHVSAPRARYLATLSSREDPPASARAMLAPHLRDSHSPLMGIKTLSYAEEQLLLAQARARGFDEVLRRNLDGRLTEGTWSNLFVIEGTDLVTPPLGEGLLAGITRWFLLRTARENGYEPREEPVTIERLRGAEEAFLTSTTRGIIPLVALDETPIGGGAPGPRAVRLARILERHVTRGGGAMSESWPLGAPGAPPAS